MANKYKTLPNYDNVVRFNNKMVRAHARNARKSGIFPDNAYPFDETTDENAELANNYARCILRAIEEEACKRDAEEVDAPFYLTLPTGDGYYEAQYMPYLNAALEDRGVTDWYIADTACLDLHKEGHLSADRTKVVRQRESLRKPRLYRHKYISNGLGKHGRMHPTFEVKPFDLAAMVNKQLKRREQKHPFTFDYDNNNLSGNSFSYSVSTRTKYPTNGTPSVVSAAVDYGERIHKCFEDKLASVIKHEPHYQEDLYKLMAPPVEGAETPMDIINRAIKDASLPDYTWAEITSETGRLSSSKPNGWITYVVDAEEAINKEK